MKNLWLLLSLFVALPASAGDQSSWKYAYVVRSTSLETKAGPASLVLSGGHFSGNLAGIGGDIRVDGQVKGSEATASIGSKDSSGMPQFKGAFYQSAAPDGTCRQTIQLLNGPNSLTLARNAPRCEP